MTRHLVHASPTPRAGPAPAGDGLTCRVRLADGRVIDGPLAPERHRAIQLGILHADSDGLVELTPGTRAPDGTLHVDRRGRPEHFLPGGARGDRDWLARLLAHAERILTGAYARHPSPGSSREEAFVGVAPRTHPRGSKHAVAATRLLWVDLDRPERLDALWTLLAERPCHLLIESGGSGGAHAYWKLTQPLPATATAPDGAVAEPIERANGRLIRALGVDANGRPDVGDPRCAERSRVMRLAGTINHKSGAWARVIQADLALEPYTIDALLDGLPEPEPAGTEPRAPRQHHPSEDPYKRIAPPEYFLRLAGVRVAPSGGLVRCPAAGHQDTHPSCSVGAHAEDGWCCHAASCGARGAIYDLASVLTGGPWGPALRGAAFTRAHQRVAEAFGPAAPTPPPTIAAAQPTATNSATAPAVTELWQVVVHDHVDARIAGHDGSHYTSPPQPRAQATALVALLGGPVEPDGTTERWTHPIAGGRRTIRLQRVP